MIPEIWSTTDRTFSQFWTFFALLQPPPPPPSPYNPEKQNFEKIKKVSGYIIFYTSVP